MLADAKSILNRGEITFLHDSVFYHGYKKRSQWLEDDFTEFRVANLDKYVTILLIVNSRVVSKTTASHVSTVSCNHEEIHII